MIVYFHNNNIKTTDVYDTYWRFAYDRQNIFWDRYKKTDKKTTDPIISKYKFTNCYRINDRVSQYLIRYVIYNCDFVINEEDMLFRILFFKIFNRIETWQYIIDVIGEISYRTFDIKKYKKAFEELIRYIREDDSS